MDYRDKALFFACEGNEIVKRSVEQYNVHDYYTFLMNKADWKEATKPQKPKKK